MHGLQRDLEEPVVADALGKLYNKDALLEFLLAPPPSATNPISSRPFGADGLLAAGHLRSLKDVQNLKLTPTSSNAQQSISSASNAETGGQIEYGKARWECPITLRGMNGAVRFVYVQGCGCVASEVGLRELAGRPTGSPKDSKESNGSDDKAVCPICAQQLPGPGIELVTLNPAGEEKEAVTKAWAAKILADEVEKAEKKAAKKSKKRKDVDVDNSDITATDTKKIKTVSTSISSAQQQRKLQAIPDGKKQPMSKAVASLYSSNKDPSSKLSPLFSSGYSRVG